ncbi:MAG: hypothetical protein H0X24_00065 [Ktedonobacterales bacterium]|nr:hypothetical protein [Ktedonobacterales bacterium]
MPTWLRHVLLSLCLLLAGLATVATPVHAATLATGSPARFTPAKSYNLNHPVTLPPHFGRGQLTQAGHMLPMNANFPDALCANDRAYVIGFSTAHGFEAGVPYSTTTTDNFASMSGWLYYLWCPANGSLLQRFFPEGFNFAESTFTLSGGPCQWLIIGANEFNQYAPGNASLHVYSGTNLITATYQAVASSPPNYAERLLCPGQTLRDFSNVANGRYSYVAMLIYDVEAYDHQSGGTAWIATPYPR